MAVADTEEDMVKYQFQADDGDWTEWKRTVPRDKSLETRINELIEADTEGRVVDVDVVELRDTLDRALDQLPEDAPGRMAIEDAQAMLEGNDGNG